MDGGVPLEFLCPITQLPPHGLPPVVLGLSHHQFAGGVLVGDFKLEGVFLVAVWWLLGVAVDGFNLIIGGEHKGS
jgi:hypothetical protein